MANTRHIFFWPHTDDVNIASFRIRCKKIVDQINQVSEDIVCEYSIKLPEKADLIILSKRYDLVSLNAALAYKKKCGAKILLDLCDNHFLIDSKSSELTSRASQLVETIKKVDGVISSTQYLSDVIKKYCGNEIKITVVGDIVEKPIEEDISILPNPLTYLRYQKLKRDLENCMPDVSRRFVWFGNHQGSVSDSGMLDLQRIKSHIEQINSKLPVSLTVVSNSKKKYNSIFKNWGIKTFYVEWNKASISAVLKLHAVSLIPASENAFTYAKTDNRVTASLVHGLQVIADPIPSYLQHADRVFINDWSNSLSYVLNPESKKNNDFNLEINNGQVIENWKAIFKKTLNNE